MSVPYTKRGKSTSAAAQHLQTLRTASRTGEDTIYQTGQDVSVPKPPGADAGHTTMRSPTVLSILRTDSDSISHTPPYPPRVPIPSIPPFQLTQTVQPQPIPAWQRIALPVAMPPVVDDPLMQMTIDTQKQRIEELEKILASTRRNQEAERQHRLLAEQRAQEAIERPQSNIFIEPSVSSIRSKHSRPSSHTHKPNQGGYPSNYPSGYPGGGPGYPAHPGGGYGGPGGPGSPGGHNPLFVQPLVPQQNPLIKIKTADPDFYDGSPQKLEDWFRQMDTLFILQSYHFQTEQAKILTAYHYCRGGNVGEWAKHHSEQYLNALGGYAYVNQDIVWTWGELKLKMKERFGDKYQKETARSKMARIAQGTKTMKEYIETFTLLVPKVGLPEDQLCQFLIGGVNNEIWDMLRLVNIPTNDLNALIQILETAEKNWVEQEVTKHQREAQQRRKWEKAGKTPSSSNNNKNYFQSTRKEVAHTPQRPNPQRFIPRPAAPSGPRPLPPGEPMDIDRMRNKPIRCFRCLQEGHMKKDCKATNIRELTEEAKHEILMMHFAQSKEEPEEEIDLLNPYKGKVKDENLHVIEGEETTDEEEDFQ